MVACRQNAMSAMNATSMSGKASAVFFAYFNAFRFFSVGVFYYIKSLNQYPRRTFLGVA